MSKFSNSNIKNRPASGPTGTTGRTFTHEGGVGFEKDDKTALYTLACTDMVQESTFYESGSDRYNRLVSLVKGVVAEDPAWVASFIPFLRNTANMRSSSIVLAAEYAKAITDLRAEGVEIDAPPIRGVINSACSRADEPAEILGYWLSTHGRRVPMGVKRGIADAAIRLYNEYASIKYDGGARGVRPADVIDLTHPKPTAEWQSLLFRHLIDRRHGNFDGFTPEQAELLPKLSSMYDIDHTPVDQRRALLSDPQRLSDAGYTWERLGGWVPGGMDAAAWESIIPSMGYMALLRNLRNFEERGVSKDTLRKVEKILRDPEAVAKSRQFPFRFWSAFKNSGTIFFGAALEEALDLSCQNIPKFRGRTLIMVDTSGSMQGTLSGNSVIRRVEVAGLFGAAVAGRNGKDNVALCHYGDTWESLKVHTSILRSAQDLNERIGKVGHGTQTWPSTVEAFNKLGPFDRIIVFTDEQDHPASAATGGNIGFYPDPRGAYVGGGFGGTRYSRGKLPPISLPDVPTYVWDLAGYGAGNVDLNEPGRYMFGGFTDAAFRMVPLLEVGIDSGWPWDQD